MGFRGSRVQIPPSRLSEDQALQRLLLWGFFFDCTPCWAIVQRNAFVPPDYPPLTDHARPEFFYHAPREMALQFYRYRLAVIRGELPSALPVFGRYPGGTAKRLREMALVGETRLERNKRNGFLAK